MTKTKEGKNKDYELSDSSSNSSRKHSKKHSKKYRCQLQRTY